MPPSTKTPSSPRAQPTGRKVGVRQQAAQDARETILRAATRIFAKHGFAGGRVDQISKASKSYDRMIYYYFGSKEKLFIAVLEEMYRRFNIAESSLQWDEAQPQQALAAVTTFIWNYYQRNPEFITLLNDENLHRGKHIAKSLKRKSTHRQPFRFWKRFWRAASISKSFVPTSLAVTFTSPSPR